MKKKELEKIEKFPATKAMLETARKDRGEVRHYHYSYSNNRPNTYLKYQYYRYFLAKVIGEYLVVGMYLRRDLVAGQKVARFYIYITKDDFITYDTEQEKWSNAKIDLLDYKREPGQQEEDHPYLVGGVLKLVNNFLNMDRQSLVGAILSHQYAVRKEQLIQKNKRITDAIDEEMELIPSEPKNFTKWLDGDGMCHSRYIFYHAEERGKKKSGYCTCCGQKVMVENPRADVKIHCPSCKKEVQLKGWKRQKTIKDNAIVVLFQKLLDNSGYVMRKYRVYKVYRMERNWQAEMNYYEETRDVYYPELTLKQHYEKGNFATTGIYRWCYNANQPNMKSWYVNQYLIDDARVYPGNIKELRKESIFKYIPLEEALRKNPGYYLHINNMLNTLKYHQEVEYLIKLKLWRLAIQFLDGKLELKEGKTPWDKLGISKEQFELCQKSNGDLREVNMLQSLNEMGYRADWKQIRYLNRIYGPTAIKDVLPGTTIHKLIRYTENREKEERFAGDYVDYLEMAGKLEWDLNQSDVRFPKNFKEKHDEAAELVREKEDKLAKMKVAQQNKEFTKLVAKLAKKYAFEDEDYKIILPTCKQDFINEGQTQHICVGSAGYFDKMLKGQTVVMFLRRAKEPDKPFCTVEIKGFEIIQCRAAYNAAPEEAVTNWMKQYVKAIQKRELEEMRKVALMAAV